MRGNGGQHPLRASRQLRFARVERARNDNAWSTQHPGGTAALHRQQVAGHRYPSGNRNAGILGYWRCFPYQRNVFQSRSVLPIQPWRQAPLYRPGSRSYCSRRHHGSANGATSDQRHDEGQCNLSIRCFHQNAHWRLSDDYAGRQSHIIRNYSSRDQRAVRDHEQLYTTTGQCHRRRPQVWPFTGKFKTTGLIV